MHIGGMVAIAPAIIGALLSLRQHPQKQTNMCNKYHANLPKDNMNSARQASHCIDFIIAMFEISNPFHANGVQKNHILVHTCNTRQDSCPFKFHFFNNN